MYLDIAWLLVTEVGLSLDYFVPQTWNHAHYTSSGETLPAAQLTRSRGVYARWLTGKVETKQDINWNAFLPGPEVAGPSVFTAMVKL